MSQPATSRAVAGYAAATTCGTITCTTGATTAGRFTSKIKTHRRGWCQMEISLLLTMWVILIICFVRNRLTFKYRQRRLAEIRWLFDHGDLTMGRHFLEEYEKGESYHEQAFDLTKWAYKQFYPKEIHRERATPN